MFSAPYKYIAYCATNFFFELKSKIGCKNLYFKAFIEGNIHLNETGNRIIENSFLKEYNN